LAFNKKTIDDIELKHGTRVVLRAEFDVPLDENNKIIDTSRIDKSLPTIERLLSNGVKLVVLAHLGRPEGKVEPLMSLAPVAKYLKEKLNSPMDTFTDTVGPDAAKMVNAVEPGTLLLLENTRFHPEEEINDASYAKKLASYGDYFVQECFGVAHRKHASIVGVAEFLPSVAGYLLAREVDTITRAMEKPNKPMLAVVGGAKVSDKIKVLERLIEIADIVAIGGAMANTFLKADDMDIGSSIYEENALEHAEKIINMAHTKEVEKNFTFYLPQDGVVATDFHAKGGIRIVDWTAHLLSELNYYPSQPDPSSYEVAKKEMILDIGPLSANYIAGLTRTANTVIWSGNLGYTETRPKVGTVGPFEHGSHTLLSAIDKNYAPKDQFSIIGGGDTSSYVLGVKGIKLPDHVSTGGSAALELMAGNKLPGVEVLDDKRY
jgi:phosphoglycerate kinase